MKNCIVEMKGKGQHERTKRVLTESQISNGMEYYSW